MIFVAVGTQKFQLNRLLSMVDNLLDSGDISEEVFAQTGNSDYQPRNYKSKKFMDKSEFDKMISDCNLLITHCGVGTIITGLMCKKPIIVFPRLKKYKEHVDDHQLQIADSFSSLNYVIQYNENDDLGELIKTAKNHQFSSYISKRDVTVQTIEHYLDTLDDPGNQG